MTFNISQQTAGLVNNVAAVVDAVTASVASTHRTATGISLRTTGKRPPSPPILYIRFVFAKTVSIIRALLFPGWLSSSARSRHAVSRHGPPSTWTHVTNAP